VNRYKIALLVLLLGASVFNVVNAWQKQTILSTYPTSTGILPLDIAEASARATVDAQNRGAQKAAWLREIAIVTIGAVLWFLIPAAAPKTK
jgi:hypothetical protein